MPLHRFPETPGPRSRPRVAVGRADALAKAVGLGIGLLLGFVVLSLAQMPGSAERQAEIERYNTQRAEAFFDLDLP